MSIDNHQCDYNSKTKNGLCFHLLYEEIIKLNLPEGESRTININGVSYVIKNNQELYLVKEGKEKAMQIIKKPYYA